MVIVGKGKVANRPYRMPYTDGQVYSIEELCYYIYNNIYTINEDFFQPALPAWLTEELDMSVLSSKLAYMIEEEHGIKDLVVAVLCSCDYYKEEEIRRIVEILDEITNLPIYKRKKMKADNYLRAGCYGKSLYEYRKLLHGSFAINFTPEEYGDILHNQGIAHFYISSFEEAMEDFKEAYVRNHKADSLQHYLWILLMQGKAEEFEEEAHSFGISQKESQLIRIHYQEALADFRLPKEHDDDITKYKAHMRQAFIY